MLIKPEDSVTDIGKVLSKLNGEIYLRPHPMIEDTVEWQNLSAEWKIKYSNPKEEDIDSFLSKISCVVESLGVHKQILEVKSNRAYVIAPEPFNDIMVLPSTAESL